MNLNESSSIHEFFGGVFRYREATYPGNPPRLEQLRQFDRIQLSRTGAERMLDVEKSRFANYQ